MSELVEIEGILRKAEEPDFLMGKFNDFRVIKLQQIDIKKLIGFFYFSNEDAPFYYLERSVEDNSTVDQYPLPNSY